MRQSAGQLVYVVGPSGAGKDSILSWLEAHGAGALRMVRARRTITRPNVPGAEAHEAVTAEQVRAAFARTVRPDRMVTVVVGAGDPRP